MSSDAVSGRHVVSPSNYTSNSQSDSQSPLLHTQMTFDTEVDPLNDRADTSPSPYARDSGEDCDRRWVENWCRHADAVALLSAIFLIVVATFFSHYYLTSQSNPHDMLAFYHVRIRKFLGGSSGGVISTTVALAATSFPKPLVIGAAVLTCVLWLASMTVGLGCVVLSVLLRHWIARYALMDGPRYGFRSPGVVSAFLMQHRSSRNVEATLRILREWLLVAVFLFLWGLDIRLLQTPKSPPPLVIIGLSITFFTGLWLVLAAWPPFPSSRGADTIPV
ncbi:hypothetical protein V8E53_009828 [Lactarius tabidus]